MPIDIASLLQGANPSALQPLASANTLKLSTPNTGQPIDALGQLAAVLQSQKNDQIRAQQADAALAREDAIRAEEYQNKRDLANLSIENAQKIADAKAAAAIKKALPINKAFIKKNAKAFEGLGLTDEQIGNLKLSDLKAFVNKPSGQNINVNVGDGENSASKAFGKSIGEAAAKRNEQASLAVTNNASLDRFEQALNSGAKTGIGRETLSNIRNIAQSFGVNLDAGLKALNINPSNLTEDQVVNALGNQLALQLRNPKSGGGLPGATSNRDLDFLKASVPGLSRTPEGNRAMIAIARKLNGLKIAVAQEQARIMRDNGGAIPLDMEARLVDFANNQKLFSDAEKESIKALSKKASANDLSITVGGRTITFPDKESLDSFKKEANL